MGVAMIFSGGTLSLNFQKISKIYKNCFLTKLLKMDYFSTDRKKFNKQGSNFARLDEKRNLQDIFEKVSKIFKDILKKIAKMHYLNIFFKEFSKPCVNFLTHLDEKLKLLRNFEKIMKILMKIL